jgi:hypothetical protein
MKGLFLTAVFSLLCALPTNAQSCASRPGDWHELSSSNGSDKKYLKKRNVADEAFRQGKYKHALAEYRQSLAFKEEEGFPEVYFKLGETYALLGNFDKAYACVIESGSSKVPGPRVIAPAILDAKARTAAQTLLDTIQLNLARYPYETFPEYLALAAIFRHAGLASQAQSAEEEGRINREAANAWHAALEQRSEHASLVAADRAAIDVYERCNRPENAAILRAQLASEPPLPPRKRSWWVSLVTGGW